MSKLIQEKGYKIEVVSWENDGDNYRTEYMIEECKETAIAIARLARDLFASENDRENPGGIGNSYGDSNDKILDYFRKNPFLIKDEDAEEDTIDFVTELADQLMGYTEHYDYRVCEEVNLTYTPVDIYDTQVTTIEF